MTPLPRLRIFVALAWSAQQGYFSGGKKKQRDSWFGLENKPDFQAFRRWWHRNGKHSHGGADIANASEALERYDEWVSLGRPTVN